MLGKKGAGNSLPQSSKLPKGPGVWLLLDKKLKYIKITTGISDGNYTEAVAGYLNEGQQIIIDAAQSNKKNDSAGAAPRFLR